MDHDNYNEIDYEEFREKKRGPVGKTVRFLCTLLSIAFCVFLGARIHINNTVPADAKALCWDEDALAAYHADPESFVIWEHKLDTYTHPDTGKTVIRNTMTEDAYFSFSDVCYTPAADQLQLTLRYNVSTVEYLMRDYGLTEEPAGELFLFALEDGEGNRYFEYDFTAHSRSFFGTERYRYRRLLFHGVDPEECDTLTLRIYYAGDTAGYEVPAEQDAVLDEIVIYDEACERAYGRRALEFTPPA